MNQSPTIAIFPCPFLPSLQFYITISMTSTKPAGGDFHLLLKSKSPPARLQNYEDKLQSALQLNCKLKDLLQTMRNNAVARKAQQTQAGERGGDDQHILRLKRKEGKLTSELQQLTNNLNVLISENGKLKAQVDVSRNSRVIYSNVYKTIEKEIRKHEYLYKLAIIDYLCYEEVEKRTRDRVTKTARRIEKDIGELQGGAKPQRKKDKRKSRLDTGLSHGVEGMDTCRASEERTTRQNPSQRETALSRRDPQASKRELIQQRLSTDKVELAGLVASQRKEEGRAQRAVRSRAHIVTEQVDSYFELEMKSNYYDNLMKHLREITGQEDLRAIFGEWKEVQAQVEAEYRQYMQLQREAKAVREDREALQRHLEGRSEREIGGGGSVQEQQLAAVGAEVQAQRARVCALEEQLTALLDINSSRLSDEEIGQHVQRIKRRGDATSRELEKLLESVNKERGASMGVSRVTNKSRLA